MLQAHGKLVCPGEDAILWRFVDFAKLVALLETKCLHFCRLTEFQDKYEGVFPDHMLDRLEQGMRHRLAEQAEESIEWFRYRQRMRRQDFFVSCWHSNKHESAAMWSLYQTSDRVAIQTTFGRMRRAFSATKPNNYPALVQYLDYSVDELPYGNEFSPVAHKRKSFEHESELRLIWWAPENGAESGASIRERNDSVQMKGVSVEVDVRALVQHVRISPTAADWFKGVVEAVVKRYGLECPVTKSNLYSDPIR